MSYGKHTNWLLAAFGIIIAASLLHVTDVTAASAAASEPNGGFLFVDTDTHRIVDHSGRERVFHGVNVVYKTFPYVADTTKFDPRYSFSEDDVKVLKKWGFNAIRLGVMWPGLEPVRGSYNETYLHQLQTIVDSCAAAGIYVLLDMHQDDFSEKFCGEGVPLWAAQPSEKAKGFPFPIAMPYNVDNETHIPSKEDCAKHNWPSYYFSEAQGSAVENLYTNQDGLLDSLSAFWAKVAATWRNDSYVIGYEIINEPWAGNVERDPELLIPGVADKKFLEPVYDQVHKSIRNVDDSHLFFYESVTWDDVLVGFEHGPGGEQYHNRSVLAYHYYKPPNLDAKQAFKARKHEAERLGGGWFCTETNSEDSLETCDEYFQSWLYWDYKLYGGITGDGNGLYHGNGTLNKEEATRISRTFAPAVAGHVELMQFDRDTARFTLVYTINTAATLPTEIYANEEAYYPNGAAFTISPANFATVKRVEASYYQITHTQDANPFTPLTIVVTPKA